MDVHAELMDNGRYIQVKFPYDAHMVAAAKSVATSKFVGPDKPDGPYWRYKTDVDTCNMLRQAFGTSLRVGRALGAWYKAETATVDVLRSLARADTATLTYLPDRCPDLYKLVSNRPYQLADIAFMAANEAPVNANQPGTGKTKEIIGAVFEHETLWDGPQFVIAPKTSLEVVWEEELMVSQDMPIIVVPEDKRGRIRAVDEAVEMWKDGYAFWFVCNPAMVTLRRTKQDDPEDPTEKKLEMVYPPLFDIEWKHIIVDEFHKMGLGNNATLTYKALQKIKREKAIAVSGTPMGGKPIKFYGVLSFVRPDVFTSKWHFADQWLFVDDNGYGKSIGKIRPDRQDAFFAMLDRYMVRRTKAEVAPQLPPKMVIDVWVDFDRGSEQERQYKEFERLAAIKIDEEELSVTSALAEYTRLKQFADAEQDIIHKLVVKDGEQVDIITLKPRPASIKLPQVERILNELGIDPEDPDGDEQVVIASQFSQIVDMVHDYLKAAKYPVARITGDVSSKERTRLIRAFQDDDHPLRVMCLTTTAGGVSITLDRASTIIVLDETWVPDDTEQLVDRLHRVSKIHQVVVYMIRVRNTVEEYVEGVNIEKQDVNELVLDIRRKMKTNLK